ncbi:hypothetical protein M8C21_031510 [Ambrosia artemisiifolia]|uniref:Angio-associated migratory cell protein n=1 Tax=Ambrosia artemisiifolia TaxID=4212 RepID=A0AAD5GP73_AMBAR|nr:hypothetical protein M8C21_031510 [Ambrosia artemisiifolia]
MSANNDDEDNGEVFLNEDDDILEEIYNMDQQADLPKDADEAFNDEADDDDDSIHIFTGHMGELYTVACTRQLVATGAGDDKGFLWKIGQPDWAFELHGKTICTGSDDASLRVWNPSTGKNNHVVKGHYYHTEGLTCLTITADSSLVLTGSKDASVYIVNIATGKVVSSLASHSESVECIGLSAARSPWAATGSMDQKLIIWDLQHSLARCTCEHEEGVTCLTWLGVTRFVATGCVDGKVRIWDSLSGECVKTLRGHTDAIQSLATSSDGNHLVSVSLDGTARVFEINEFC